MRRTVAGRRGLAQAIWAKNDLGEVGREGLRPDGDCIGVGFSVDGG